MGRRWGGREGGGRSSMGVGTIMGVRTIIDDVDTIIDVIVVI